MSNIQAKSYDFSTVSSITQKQLEEHYTLYKGYINKLNEIWNMPIDANKYGEGNSTYSDMRSLKLGETYAVNGVKLHQLYFENITGKYKGSPNMISKLILRDFLSFENFYNYFRKVGLSMRGWAILVFSPEDNRLHIIGSDAHDVGAIWTYIPLLVMDVYEHAYFLDFGIDRKKYIDIFFQNINWSIVDERLKLCYESHTILKNYRSSGPYFFYPRNFY